MEKEDVKQQGQPGGEEDLLDFDLDDLELGDFQENSGKAEQGEEIIDLVDLVEKGQGLGTQADEGVEEILEEAFSLEEEPAIEGFSEEISQEAEEEKGEESLLDLDFSGISLEDEMEKAGEETGVEQALEGAGATEELDFENILEEAPSVKIDITLQRLEEPPEPAGEKVEGIEEGKPSMEPVLEMGDLGKQEDFLKVEAIHEPELKVAPQIVLEEFAVEEPMPEKAAVKEEPIEDHALLKEPGGEVIPAISEEKIEAIVSRVVQETVERVARETLDRVAERLITEAIEALKNSLESSAN